MVNQRVCWELDLGGNQGAFFQFMFAFQRLKAALTQQHPPVTNGDAVKGHSSGLVRTQSEESRPQSLQQPATSTTETPVCVLLLSFNTLLSSLKKQIQCNLNDYFIYFEQNYFWSYCYFKSLRKM